ncbi:beta-galactosidase [Longispora fulva]|uniref:Beta-galactosidase n=1 Tax=Longispora fulva TaxID=619741 RepID=A0A8J7G9P4_9ACTN|nr:beta-galactosidase [Longispora fulva]MBG6136353.1 beta-galactosidase [Longispora fulva]GIG63524.1 beta-galactosidase [Longispora fulva]
MEYNPGQLWPVVGQLGYGADYYPEQWDPAVWAEDIALMRQARVNTVSLGIFAWSQLEPEPGRFEFGALDRVIGLLHEAGIRINMATPTAGPPAWLAELRPETLPRTAAGVRLGPGSRQAFCPSSPVYRQHAVAITAAVAKHVAGHPAIAMWHVHNEYGNHNTHCYCEVSAEAFRGWLRARYGSLDALNAAWGTEFWSQRYGNWRQVTPPLPTPTYPNPTQQLDFARFSSDELLTCFTAERDVLRQATPGIPVTTNLTAGMHTHLDHWAWAEQMDIVSNDHYLPAEDPDTHVDLAFAADLTRSLAGGKPWLLMEHSTSAVNWQPRNLAKRPGEMLRNSLAHVARGADGVMFFQWRASAAGAEKYHSAMVPHAGTRTRIWREVLALGETLEQLGELAGTVATAEVAILWDYEAAWACDLPCHPSVDVRYEDMARRVHAALFALGITADFAHPNADLSGYKLVIAPTLYLVDDAAAHAIAEYVRSGGHVLVTYLSGIVDHDDHIRLGGYPGAFRELLGIFVEEFYPLAQDQTITLDNGNTTDVWTELLTLDGAEAIATYADGPLPGVPAITRNGTAWYMATRLDPTGMRDLLSAIADEAAVTRPLELHNGLELVTRHDAHSAYLFALNHTDQGARVATTGVDLLTGETVTGEALVPAGGVRVIRQCLR